MRSTSKQQRGAALAWLLGVLVVGAILVGLYAWFMLSWSYSEGERAGWIQKLSKKGFVCKTWEGEMAMVSLPGSIPEKFAFTVHDDAVAQQINAVIGKRVSLHYTEHIGLPTSCFGETRHFVRSVKAIEETPAPLPVAPAMPPAQSAPPTPNQQPAPSAPAQPKAQ